MTVEGGGRGSSTAYIVDPCLHPISLSGDVPIIAGQGTILHLLVSHLSEWIGNKLTLIACSKPSPKPPRSALDLQIPASQEVND